MFSSVLALDGQERTRTHMERNLVEAEASLAHIVNHLSREVQTRSRCCHRALELGIDRLVAL